MKKAIALILALCICLSLTACGESKTDDPSTDPTEAKQTVNVKLPHGLSFGMSHGDAKAAYALLPDITPAQANDGYFGAASASHHDTTEFYGVSNSVAAFCLPPYEGFSFNEDKELYEYYLLFEPFDESYAESAASEMFEYFIAELGDDVIKSETDSALTAKWDSDSVAVELSLTEDENGKFQIILTLHDKTHELSD